MSGPETKSAPRPYDQESLERAALNYVGRYATTRAKLGAYLNRKLKERGWAGEDRPSVESLIDRFAERGYVNDALFAQSRADSLLRRGYGARRITASLRAAGIDQEVTDTLRDDIATQAERSAMVFARRRKIGPFAQKPQDSVQSGRSLAAMLRAGHGFAISRRILEMTEDHEDVDCQADSRDAE